MLDLGGYAFEFDQSLQFRPNRRFDGHIDARPGNRLHTPARPGRGIETECTPHAARRFGPAPTKARQLR